MNQDHHSPMQSRLLFDLDQIDLSRIVVSREEIERYNPHRGCMAMLDGVIWHSEDFRRVVGVKYVREDEFWVAGHFPQQPIMPGVLLVEAGAQLANYIFRLRRSNPCIAGFIRIREAVFRGQVHPGDTLYLLSREVKLTAKRFISDLQGVVDGRIVFHSRVSGIVLRELPVEECPPPTAEEVAAAMQASAGT